MSATGFLGLDIGGTGAKAAVYDAAGQMLGSGQVAYAPLTSHAGHTEIDIEIIYDAARTATRQAVAASGAHILSLAVATQGQTFVTLDSNDAPLHKAILWYDSRASAEADGLKAALNGMLPPDQMPFVEAIAAGPKIMWLRRHDPDTMAAARRFLLLPDFIAYRLTGQAVTDPCTASTTALYVEGAADYAPAALAAAHIERAALARIQSPASPIATVRAELAPAWGLSEDTLVVTGTNDQYAGALGAGNYRPGILTETTGTCLALVALFERQNQHVVADTGLLFGRFPVAGLDYALAYAKTAGLVVEWFSRQVAHGMSLSELETLAAIAPIGSRGICVLPHFDGMVSPLPNLAARGAFLNLALSHTPGDMYRAVLESIAFSLRENIELLRRCGLVFNCVRSIGGGARSDLWLQIKADVLGGPIERPAVTEAATLGAAMLAAVGAGAFASPVDCSAAFYRSDRTFMPDAHNHRLYEPSYQAYRDLYHKLCVER